MARVCKLAGVLLTVVGVAIAVAFATMMARDEEYAKKELIVARNPTNDIYKLDLGFAQIKRGFQLVSLSGGALLALNGVTLIVLGAVAGRATRPTGGA